MSGRKNIAIIGPSLSGKTTLLESFCFVAGAISRKGKIKEGNTVGDGSAEARERQMSVEVSVASIVHEGVNLTFLDCPGSIELLAEAQNALMGVDGALVVCEADADRAAMLAPVFRILDTHKIPHVLFINKIDRAGALLRSVIPALQAVSTRPLVLHQVPIREGENVTGYVDLASEHAFAYHADAASTEIEIPASVKERESEARTEMLESLADFDDALLEALLEDILPTEAQIEDNFKVDVAKNAVVPVFLGAAELENGVRRLLNHLVHLIPDAAVTAKQRGIEDGGGILAQVLKTYLTPHGGKLSLVRIWRGSITDGSLLNGVRCASVNRMLGIQQEKLSKAVAGEIVALGRMEAIIAGETLVQGNEAPENPLPGPEPLPPVYSMSIKTEKRDDEVKMSTAVAKIIEEDPSLSVEQNPDTQEYVLWGQGEIHLQVAIARLRNKYGLVVTADRPKVPYKEAIRKPMSQHGRFKRQTGGHGMFGDVHLDIKPLPRGSGFQFDNRITGGVVPKQYIPSVETGIRDYLVKGPLGFPVVDISVTLTDGSFHSVDSSDQAFKLAGQVAMREGMPKCDPVLLEPILRVDVAIPNEYTNKVLGLVSGRRGQILGFKAKEDWKGWDSVEAYMPQSEIHDLIIELRSISLGVGTYAWAYDHLAELTGRLADQVLAQHSDTAEVA